MLDAADEIVVPALPARIAGKSFSAPIAALLPVASAKWQAASTFGPIEPAGNLKSRIACGLARLNALAVGFPQSRNTASASVAIMKTSASSSRAKSSEHRSLSITASIPRSTRPGSYTVGMPPPPAAMTIVPFSSSHFIGRISNIRLGSGDATNSSPFVAVHFHCPALLRGERLQFSLGINWSNELRRIFKSRVITIDFDHRQYGGEGHFKGQEIAELLFDHVADHPFGLGTEHIEWIGLVRLI